MQGATAPLFEGGRRSRRGGWHALGEPLGKTLREGKGEPLGEGWGRATERFGWVAFVGGWCYLCCMSGSPQAAPEGLEQTPSAPKRSVEDKLTALLGRVREDARERPEEYARDTEVPEGGE